MPTCPKGHTSVATDYCDECGAPIDGAAPAVAPPAAAPASPAIPSAAPAASAPAGDPCPECATPRAGRFCEVCGHDFLAAPGSVSAASLGGSALGGSALGGSQASGSAPAASPAGPVVPAPGGWRVVATADRAYFDRTQAAAEADAEAVAFPAFCPERRFVLTGAEVLVGRRSRSRGIEPGIDLTGAPEDAGVSHAHALFVAAPDGTWSIVDLQSSNGTYLNDAADPLPPNSPVALAPGDRIHVGAWTTLTVQPA